MVVVKMLVTIVHLMHSVSIPMVVSTASVLKIMNLLTVKDTLLNAKVFRYIVINVL